MSVNGEGPKPPKGRVRQFLGFVLIIGASVLALAAVQLLSPKGRSDSDLLLERLLEAGSKPTPFSTVMPDPDWDTVCYLGPYDKSSRMLSFLLNKDITEFTFQPYDQIMAEPENGVAFIDYEKRTVLVHTLNMIEKWGPAIYFISGPRCLTRGSASFLVERSPSAKPYLQPALVYFNRF
jgi:hypothetical protein